MTEHDLSVVDLHESTPEGAQGLAAARLARETRTLLRRAVEASGLQQRSLAAVLRVSEGRVSQVLNGDGNLRIATLARFLRAAGYEAQVCAVPIDPNQDWLHGKSRPRSERRAQLTTNTYVTGTFAFQEIPSAQRTLATNWVGGSYSAQQLTAWAQRPPSHHVLLLPEHSGEETDDLQFPWQPRRRRQQPDRARR